MATRSKHPRTAKPLTKELRPDQTTARGLTQLQFSYIGEVVASWSNLELTMQRLIWAFLKLDDDNGRLVTAKMDARPKVEWLRVLGERDLPDGIYADKFFEALSRIEELQDDRNFIVHGTWSRLLPENHAIAASLRRKSLPGKITAETFPDDRMKAIVHDINVALAIIREGLTQLSALSGK